MSDHKDDQPIPTTGVWGDIYRMKAKYETELANAREVAKEAGFKNVRCSDVGLLWYADRSPAAKYDDIGGRPDKLGGASSAAELIEQMRKFIKPAAPGGGATGLTEEDHAKAAAFLDAKR